MWRHSEAHPGEYLRARFLEPLGLTAADLARGCKMSRSRVSEILAGKRAITADTAKRLAAFFRMEAEAWMALQAAWELEQAQHDDAISPLDPPGFLVGPSGAIPYPNRPRARRPQLRFPDLGESSADYEGESERQTQEHREVRYADGTRALVARRK